MTTDGPTLDQYAEASRRLNQAGDPMTTEETLQAIAEEDIDPVVGVSERMFGVMPREAFLITAHEIRYDCERLVYVAFTKAEAETFVNGRGALQIHRVGQDAEVKQISYSASPLYGGSPPMRPNTGLRQYNVKHDAIGPDSKGGTDDN